MPNTGIRGKRQAQDALISHVTQGYSIATGLTKIGRTRKTYEDWRHDDPAFKERLDQARALATHKEPVKRERMGFAEFRRRFLRTETFWHQQQWVDLLEGHEPRNLHGAQTYQQARRDRLLILTPPFHAKSTTVSVHYSVYRLCMDPAYRVLIISAGGQLAQDFLFQIKQILTSPDFRDLQMAYAPTGGWEASAEQWTTTRIVFGTDIRSEGARQEHDKDPNVEAIGMRSKIYGKRADLIIVDDGVDSTNVNEYDKQMRWLRNMVATRIQPGGKLVVVGTRVASIDLYSELMNPANYGRGKVPWTIMSSPAILEDRDDPSETVTLWPEADVPWVSGDDECICGDPTCSDGRVREDGVRVYPRWDAKHLELGPRSENTESDFQLIYQQNALAVDATFPEHAVAKATNSRRRLGLLRAETVGYPPGGMHDMAVFAGCDPAVKGYAAMVVVALHRSTGKRYLLDAVNLHGPTPAVLKQSLKSLTGQYGIQEWRVERTGLLQFFTQDADFRQWFTNKGVAFREHNTNKSSKWDPAYGVASLSSLFGSYDHITEAHGRDVGDWRTIEPPLIELPRIDTPALKALRHQLVIWTPTLNPQRTPCDLVMALWFCETGIRESLRRRDAGEVSAFRNAGRFMSRRDRKRRFSVRTADEGLDILQRFGMRDR